MRRRMAVETTRAALESEICTWNRSRSSQDQGRSDDVDNVNRRGTTGGRWEARSCTRGSGEEAERRRGGREGWKGIGGCMRVRET